MRHQWLRGHGVDSERNPMTYTVILVKGEQTRPT